MTTPDATPTPPTPLPARRLDDRELRSLRAPYEELIGFVPPRIAARSELGARLDPEFLQLVEAVRIKAMYPACFDVKTSQLMLFGMLLMDLSDAAQLHAIAARRAGASWEELQAVVSLCFLFRGLSAANRGAEIIANLTKMESAPPGKSA